MESSRTRSAHLPGALEPSCREAPPAVLARYVPPTAYHPDSEQLAKRLLLEKQAQTSQLKEDIAVGEQYARSFP